MRVRLSLAVPRVTAVLLSWLLTATAVAQIAQPTQALLREGWDTRRNNPSASLTDVHVLPGTPFVWAVGTAGGGGSHTPVVLRSTNRGSSWRTIRFGPTVGPLNAIFFTDPLRGVVVGDDGAMFRSFDGGVTWRALPRVSSRDLDAVYFADAQHGWAVGGWRGGRPYLVLRTRNGGASWQDLSFGTGFNGSDVFFLNANTGWICGRDGTLAPSIHRSDDGGMTWVRQPVPTPPGGYEVTSIRFVDRNVGWATTSSIYQTQRGAVLHTTDGGTTWTVQFYTGHDYNAELAVAGPQRIAIASFQLLGSTRSAVWTTSNGGANWTSSSPPLLTYMHGLTYDGNDLWIASNNLQLVRSRDRGQTWSWETHAPLWQGITWRDAKHGWVVTGKEPGVDGYCRRTVDGGRSWFHDPSQPGGTHAQFVDAQHGFIFQAGRSSTIFRTTDGGMSWQQSQLRQNGWIESATFVDPLNGWACGGNGVIVRTIDGGVSWQRQPTGVPEFVQALDFVNPSRGWACGGLGGGNGFILSTTDGGQTWLRQTPPTNDHLLDLDFVSSQLGLAVTVGGRVHRTRNGGASWSNVATIPHQYLDSIMMLDARRGWILARNHLSSSAPNDGRGFIYYTEDGGSSWKLDYRAPLTKSAIHAITQHPGGTVWAAGFHDAILETR